MITKWESTQTAAMSVRYQNRNLVADDLKDKIHGDIAVDTWASVGFPITSIRPEVDYFENI